MKKKLFQGAVQAEATRPAQTDGEGPADFHALEVLKASSAIADLWQERGARDRRAGNVNSQIPDMQEANRHLILATFHAQDEQALAEAVVRHQTEFLSTLAHELRNPLQPIGMANDLLGKISDFHPDVAMLHGTIKRQLTHLSRLVDEIMDVSSVNAGKVSIQIRTIVLQDVVRNTAETCQPMVNTRRQQLLLDLPAEPIYIDGDLMRLTQVFTNLLLNASKYTPEFGHLLIRVTPEQHDVEVAIIDDGAGVPVEIQPRIFDLFVQGPRPPTPAQAGLGIGLSLVRSIVQLHGGSVSVRSEGAGNGSEFVVSLPRSIATVTDKTAEPV